MAESISEHREIHARPETVWALVSDLPRMGEWSDENQGGEWIRGATGPAVGARFRGANRNGFRRWKTLVTVTDSQPGERFAFDVTLAGMPISSWSYDIEPTEQGCRVTEQWTDRRPGWFGPFARLATGVADRAEHTRVAMANTLERVAAAAEANGD